MNQRESNRGRSTRGESFRSEGMRGGQDDERERMRREMRDTYNPEPQWLREDRERGGSRGHDDEYDYGRGRYVASERGESSRDYGRETSGRGSYAGSGREWGESERGQSMQSAQYPGGGYDNAYGGSGRDVEIYGAEERGWNERGSSERGASERERHRGFSQSGQRYAGEREDYGRQSGYSRGQHDESTGAAPRWDDQDFSGGGGRYAPFRVGTGMGTGVSGTGRQGFGSSYGGASGYGGPGSGNYGGGGWEDESARHWGAQSHRGMSEYGGRAGWDLGMQQRDLGREQERGGGSRSFRGLGPQNYKRPDERIRDDVYERLTDSHQIDARHIMVDVNQGNVTLTGTVTERRMRYLAEDLVESVMGVSNITNQLKVESQSASEKQTQTQAQGSGETTAGASGTKTTETKQKH